MAWWQWSKTAASNGSADGTINMAEGMPPGAVNDGVRALMARAAEYRDDISGALTTGGSSTAYTLASNQVFDTLAHMNNAMIAFSPHATNGATVTLNVDSTGAKPLRSAPSVELPSGTLIQGTPYVVTYNASDGAFYLQGGASNPYSIPLGGMIPYIGISSTPNSAFAFPNGQAVSRTTYATLYSLVGGQFGSGDGSTTFNLPDLRGRVWAGLDNMGGASNAGRLSSVMGPNSTTVAAIGGAQQATLVTNNLPPYTPVGSITGTASVGVSLSAGTGGAATGGAFAPDTGTQLVAYSTGSRSNQVYNINNGSLAPSMNAQGGTSVPFNTVQPTLLGNYILRII